MAKYALCPSECLCTSAASRPLPSSPQLSRAAESLSRKHSMGGSCAMKRRRPARSGFPRWQHRLRTRCNGARAAFLTGCSPSVRRAYSCSTCWQGHFYAEKQLNWVCGCPTLNAQVTWTNGHAQVGPTRTRGRFVEWKIPQVLRRVLRRASGLG